MFKIDFSDQKFRAIIIQTIVVGLLAYGLYWIVQTTAYNLEKRNIATGFGFLNDPAGFDISFTPFFSFVATDSHFNVYLVGLVNTLLISVVGCIAATFLGFFVGITRLSSNWLLSKIENKHKKLSQKHNLIKDIKNSSAKVVVMLGAGDIGVLVNEVTSELLKALEYEV